MISRKVAMPLMLAASVGGPYVASQAPEWAAGSGPPPMPAAASQPASLAAPSGSPGSTLSSPWASGAVPAAPTLAPTAAQTQATAPPQGPGANVFPAKTPLEGVQTYSIAEVFRFDVSKEWVYERWARKSTALAELDLFGVRVPLVSGTQLSDVAGSLTYFFGADGRVKRISFHGQTGDTSQLVALATQRYCMQAQPTVVAGEQLFQLRNDAGVVSELRTKPAAVLWNSSPHSSFSVELELQEPAASRPLPQPAAKPPVAAAATSPAKAAGATPAVSTTGAPDAVAAPPVAAAAAKPPEPLGWKALFPRSRVPQKQIQNLDQGNLYQW